MIESRLLKAIISMVNYIIIVFKGGYITRSIVHILPESRLEGCWVLFHLILLFRCYDGLTVKEPKDTYYDRIALVGNLLIAYPIQLVSRLQVFGCVMILLGVIGLLLVLSETLRKSNW